MKKPYFLVLGLPIALVLMSLGLSRAVTVRGQSHLKPGMARALYGESQESVERQYGRPIFVGQRAKTAWHTYIKGHAKIAVRYDERGIATRVMASELEPKPGREDYNQYYPAPKRHAAQPTPDAMSAYNQ